MLSNQLIDCGSLPAGHGGIATCQPGGDPDTCNNSKQQVTMGDSMFLHHWTVICAPAVPLKKQNGCNSAVYTTRMHRLYACLHLRVSVQDVQMPDTTSATQA